MKHESGNNGRDRSRRGVLHAQPGLRTEGLIGPPSRPSLLALFLVFARISLVSFGGGVSAMLYRELVVTRRWIEESDFVAGMALAQSMPGANVVNLAIWLGSRLRGSLGSTVALLGALVPCSIIVIGVGEAVRVVAGIPVGQMALAGTAAAALGLSLGMGLRMAKTALRDHWCVAVFVLALVGASLQGTAILIILILAPISIILAWRSLPDE